MHAQLLLPDVEPPPKPVDRRAEIIAKVVVSNQFREGFCGWLHDNWGIWSRFEFEADKMRERGRRHYLSLIHISEPTRPRFGSRLPSSA